MAPSKKTGIANALFEIAHWYRILKEQWWVEVFLNETSTREITSLYSSPGFIPYYWDSLSVPITQL